QRPLHHDGVSSAVRRSPTATPWADAPGDTATSRLATMTATGRSGGCPSEEAGQSDHRKVMVRTPPAMA
ncbi:MAG: hypothetical protein ACPGSH_00365, partial [Ilumatobacteraceae bacterium]